MPELPPEVLSENKPPVKRESSSLNGIKAVIYVGVMLLVYIAFCAYTMHTNNRNIAEINGNFFGAQLKFAVVLYIVSRFLPAGWITNLRAFFLAVSVNGGMAIVILYAAFGRG